MYTLADCSIACKLPVSSMCTFVQAAAESDMLTELQWRVAALESLHAFVAGPCTRCAPLQAATLTATCASLLQPTLDAICAAPALQVPSSTLPIISCSRRMRLLAVVAGHNILFCKAQCMEHKAKPHLCCLQTDYFKQTNCI